MFYSVPVRVDYRIEPCKSALTQVRGMPFRWSLNPYMGCVHRCTFCYVRHFEQRADRPSDDRYGRSIRIKPNGAEVLRRELARSAWKHDEVALGTATEMRAMVARGQLGIGALATDDCWATYRELTARGVEFTEEPEDRFYGIDAGFRDPFGNPWRLTQARTLGAIRDAVAT